uniref:Uncharacterized protein n=1 Tax=Arundo donax TaxID=35708 RepID=A0A0A9HL30_ARUDO
MCSSRASTSMRCLHPSLALSPCGCYWLWLHKKVGRYITWM